ncbi:hypothetical protein WBG83_22680, partial [Paenibacillus sp. y28]
KVKMNGFVVSDVTDSTFTTGKFGPFSDRDYAELKDITYLAASPSSIYAVKDVALVGAPVEYETTYEDPEKDPIWPAGTAWTIEHTNPDLFLNTGDGYSGLSPHHGQTYPAPVSPFERVGLYRMTYSQWDDVTPESFRKQSNLYSRNLIVHRKPVAEFTLSANPDNTVAWSDTSYDVDRCYPGGSCMSGYEGNRGVLDRKYYYITPSGTVVKQKLVIPPETGTYTVAEAVMDEYSAWSDFYIQTITIDGTLPTPNERPEVDITNPDCGDPGACTLFYTTTPTITWTQNDADGLHFTHYRLQI